MRRRFIFLFALPALACEAPPEAPAHPTWADVMPILQGQCNHCHGATAATTGRLGPAVYRFDFFDMNEAICAEATPALAETALAASAAGLMRGALTAISGRPRMPPAPAPPLREWERDTLLRWAERPVKGPPAAGNRRPRITVNQLPASIPATTLSFIATVEDPDGDGVIGVVQLGDRTFPMDHAGSFSVRLDMTGMPAGPQRLGAVLCDGWGSAAYDLGPVQIRP